MTLTVLSLMLLFLACHAYVHKIPKNFWAFVLTLFYRRIHLNGECPDDGIPTIVVSNHANAFIDPFALQVALDQPLIRTVRGDWLNHWLVKWLAKAVGAVPLAKMSQGNAAANRTSFDYLNEQLAQGKWVVVFPEGISHNRSHLLPFRKGAAHMARQYIANTGKPIRVLQVGLYYADKSRLHSDIWVSVAAQKTYYRVDELNDVESEMSQWKTNIQSALPNPLRRKELHTLNWVNSLLPWLNPKRRVFLNDHHLWQSNSQFNQMRSWLNSEGIDITVLMRHRSAPQLSMRLFADLTIFVLGLPIALFGLLTHWPVAALHYWLTRRNSSAEDKWASSAFVIGIPLYPAYWGVLALALQSVIWLVPMIILSGFYALYFLRSWRPRTKAMGTVVHCLLQPDIQKAVQTQAQKTFAPLIRATNNTSIL